MALFELLQLAIITIYLCGTILFILGSATHTPRLRLFAGVLALIGFSLHTLDITTVLLLKKSTALSTGDIYLSLIAWSVLVIYFLVWWRFRLEIMALTTLPLALLTFLTSTIFTGIQVTIPKQLTMLFFGLHISTLALALGVLSAGFGAGLTFLYYNRKIKTKSGLKSLGKDTPSLCIFDRVNHLAVAFGFPLYTLGLFSSFVWYWIAPFKIFAWDVMKITSLGVWITFATLFHLRMLLGWKGRKPAILMITVFIAMVISLLHHTVTFRHMP